jgi:hypothetical protein
VRAAHTGVGAINRAPTTDETIAKWPINSSNVNKSPARSPDVPPSISTTVAKNAQTSNWMAPNRTGLELFS